jgi:predicted amidohydrolase
VRAAAAAGADVVVFPEMYSNGYATFNADDEMAEARWRQEALPLDGSYMEKFREAARAQRIHVVATLLERGSPDPFNSALLIDDRGDTVLHHRKVHTCFFDTPEKACGRGDTFGSVEIVTADGPVRVGLMICMDREYAQAAMQLSAEGVEIALVPNCCHLAVDPVVGDVRIAQARGRAFEAVMGLAVANYPAPRCDGRSFAVDPLGRILTMTDGRAGLALAKFDLGLIRKTRQEDWFRWRGES